MRDKEATRERILEAAEAVFAEKGYHDTIMDEIVAASSTSKGAIYFHFPSKEDLFFSLMDRLASSLLREVERAIAGQRGAVAKVQAALEAVLKNLSRRRRLARILLLQSYGLGAAFERKRLEIFERFAALIKKHLDEAVAEGSIPTIDTEVAAYAWLGAIHELVVRWLHTSKPDPLKKTLPALSGLFLRGIGFEPNPMKFEGGKR